LLCALRCPKPFDIFARLLNQAVRACGRVRRASAANLIDQQGSRHRARRVDACTKGAIVAAIVRTD
jgi:hypothetical protein